MQTLIGNEEVPLTVADALEYVGATKAYFYKELNSTFWRIGQLWFNMLEYSDQEKLRGAFFDPFYSDNWPCVIRALRFLLEN